MKKIISLIFLCLGFHLAWAQSGEGYNPPSPADPQVYYRLMLEATPTTGGTIYTQDLQQLPAGQSVYVSASARFGYKFQRWMMGEEVVSTESGFYFTMPEHDVVLTAYFEPDTDYNPANPGDPSPDGYSHRVHVYANPSVGGYFNNSNFTLIEGRTAELYAYPRDGYRFESWTQNGVVISKDNPMTVRMGKSDLEYTAIFAYNPVSPSDPGANSFNPTTGELIIDSFTPGYLYDAIYKAVGFDGYDQVKSALIIGKMQSEDFGFAYNLKNCETLDLSRTTGYTSVPAWAFEGASALKTIILPASVEKIGYNAFYRCDSLQDIYIYAAIPPQLDDDAFYGIGADVVIYVPSASLSLYLAAPGWSDLPVRSMDGTERAITVNLPDDGKKYDNMTVELQNAQSKQSYKYIVTSRRSYTFPGLVGNAIYNVYLKTAGGLVLGEIKDIQLSDEDLNLTFSTVRELQNVTLSVVTPDGRDVTSNCNITWLDDAGNYICQGNKVDNLLSGTELKYRLKLGTDLSLEYVQPGDEIYIVKEGDNNAVHTLSGIKQIEIEGSVSDAITKFGISGAKVSISQTLNGKYPKTTVVNTDSKGNYRAKLYNAPTTLSVSAYDYISMTKTLSIDTDADKFTVDDIQLPSIAGVTVTANVCFSESVKEGETHNPCDFYEDYPNVTYSVYNLTTGKQINQMSIRYPQLVIMDGAKAGDRLKISVTSKKNSFLPESAEGVVNEHNRLELPVPTFQNGGAFASFKSSANANVVGILYDASGYFVGCYDFDSNAELLIKELKEGKYTIVAMGKDAYFNYIYKLSQMKEVGMIEGTDYLSGSFSVNRGIYTLVEFNEVPVLETEKYNFFGENTSFVVDKTQIVAGNYLTLSGKIEFYSNNTDVISDVQMVVDLPLSASFVDNSVLIGNKQCNYTYSDNRLIIPVTLAQTKERIKFCVIPTETGVFSPNALVRFKAAGEQKALSMGAARYTVQSLTITVPEVTSNGLITVKGAAVPGSAIEVYDDKVMIGKATVSTTGEWSASCELPNSYNLSAHYIYAREILANGVAINSASEKCIYDKSANFVKSVTMSHYNGWYKRDESVTFDFETGKSYPKYYYYYTTAEFTFTVDFLDNSPSAVSNVVIYAYNYRGGYTAIPAQYDSDTGKWIGLQAFSSEDTPVNVSVDFSSNYEPELDMGLLDDNIDELQEALDDDNATLAESDALIDDLISKLDSGNLTASELEEGLNSYFVLITSGRKISDPADDRLLDEIDGITDDDERNQRIENERQKLDREPSSDFVEMETSLRNPVNQTIPSQSTGGKYPSAPITISSSNPILDNNDNIHLPNSNWTVNEPNSSVVHVGNGSGDNITVDLSSVLPYPDDSEEAYYEWAATAEPLMSEYLSNGATIAGHILDVMELVSANEIAKCTKNLYFDTQFMRIKLSHIPDMQQVRPADFNTLLNDIKADGQLLRQAKKTSNMVGSLGKAVGCFGTFMGGWQVGSDIRNGVNADKSWANLIENIRKCKDPGAASLADRAEEHRRWFRRRNITKGVADVATTAVGAATMVAAPATLGASLVINFASTAVSLGTGFWESQYKKTNEQNWSNILTAYNKLNCTPIKEQDPPPPRTDPTEIAWDPSGFVYEGVPSNRVQGVMATAYYMDAVEDIYGTLHEEPKVWDAEEYSQENPLFTDENGMYQWDVPQGLWQVKFEKDGYETAYSEWLPVPPPQLDVNVGIVQARQPEIVSAHAYEDAIEFVFDKYMKAQLLNSDNILVSENGNYVSGQIVLVDEEAGYDNEDEKFATTVRFVPDSRFEATEVTLTVANRVESYAGVRLPETFTQTFDIEQELNEIKVDETVVVPCGAEIVIPVSVLPAPAAVGKTLRVVSFNNQIAEVDEETYLLDSEGTTYVTVFGIAVGSAELTFTIDGYDVNAKTTVTVERQDAEYETVAKPESNYASGSSLPKGTQIILSCATPGATIYYTLDGSCPCDISPARQVYTEPIVIEDDVTIKAMAVADDMYDSEVVEFVYLIDTQSGLDQLTLNDTIDIYPLPVKDVLYVKAGGRTISRVTLSSVSGTMSAVADTPATLVSLDVSGLTPGVYVVTIETDRKTYSRKIMKVR